MKIFLVTCAALSVLPSRRCKDTSEEFPDIMDLLPKSLNGSSNRRSQDGLLVDLDTLDEARLLRNVENLRKELQLTALNSTSTTTKNEAGLTTQSPQRRYLGYLTKPVRDFVRPITYTLSTRWKVRKGPYTHMYSTKIADLMIQFIYMARHKLMELDSQTIVKPKPENYRLVFLYKHLVRLSDKIWDVHQIIRNQSRLVHGPSIHHRWVFHILKNAIRLHQKAVKLYVDFTYFWWVFMRTQERFMERTHVVITRPPATDYTFRTTGFVAPNDMADTDYPTRFVEYYTPQPAWWNRWQTGPQERR